jgi:1-acyl-sn-glycerol-3-phosphate acyltransferase
MPARPPPAAKVPPIASDLAQTPIGKLIADLPIKYFHATLEGTDRVPREGGALVVGNHALFGLDGVVLGALLMRETGRYPRFLGERNLWKVPVLGQMLTALGALAGEPNAAQTLLEDGELVAVYPGGVDDSFKLASEKYRLKWGTRSGFARVAMRAKVPILPVAAVGIDEMYDVVTRERWIGRTLFGSARYDLPIALGAYGSPLPKRVPQSYSILEPVDTSGDPDDPEAVEKVRAETYRAIETRLREVRAKQLAE